MERMSMKKRAACLNRIVMDLTSIYVELPPLYKQPETISEPDPYRFVAEKVTVGTNYYPKIRFTSMAHLPMTGSAGAGIAEIVYYVMENEDRGRRSCSQEVRQGLPVLSG